MKTWRDGTMILRWVGAAVNEAAKGFRRFRGFQDLKKLIAALDAQRRSSPSWWSSPCRRNLKARINSALDALRAEADLDK